MKKILAVLYSVLALSGCAVNYTYDGQKYDSAEKMYSAIDSAIANTLASIEPLANPITAKKLVFAIPSVSFTTDLQVSAFVKREGKPPTDQQRAVGATVNRANFMDTKVFFDAVQKRNIYTSSQFVELDSAAGIFTANKDTDVLYLLTSNANVAQWYFVSEKGGKQIFAYDRGVGTHNANVKAFVDAVQAQAIRD